MRNKYIFLLTLLLCLLYNESEAKDVHNDSISIKFVRIDGGDLLIGSAIQGNTIGDDDELSEIETYYISANEVTNFSYNECVKFIDSLNVITGKTFKLPTEAQWEYAANGRISDTEPEYGYRIVYIDSKEEPQIIILQSFQSKNDSPKYWHLYIVLVLVGLLTVYLFLRKRRVTKISSIPKDSDADKILEKSGSEGGVGNKDLDVVNPNAPAPSQPLNNESSIDKFDRFYVDRDNCLVVGASVRGKGHIQADIPCQDNSKYTYLTKGWGVSVVSDGAGSASKSQIGSKIVVERATTHFVDVIKEMKWIEHNVLPSNEDWAQIAYSVLRRVYKDIADFAQQKNIAIKDLGATVIVLIHSPLGILSTHIGDGRAGYRNCDGEWLSIIAPHKGEEANQTIFITSQFWDRPSFRMSGNLIPESIVIRDKVTGFTLMSDGCENTSWQIAQMDRYTGKVCDPNLPFQKFFDPLTKTLHQFHNDNIDANEKADAWYSFLDLGKEFSKEIDDKTLILGIIF